MNVDCYSTKADNNPPEADLVRDFTQGIMDLDLPITRTIELSIAPFHSFCMQQSLPADKVFLILMAFFEVYETFFGDVEEMKQHFLKKQHDSK